MTALPSIRRPAAWLILGLLLFLPRFAAAEVVGAMNHARASHTATLLADGRVVVIGGYIGLNYTQQAVTETYNPTTNQWTDSAALERPCSYHTATLLANGKILVVGGSSKQHEPCEPVIYDPATGTFSNPAPYPRRYGHSATLLQDGRVMVAGGVVDEDATNEVNIYDPVANTWTPVSPLGLRRLHHTATLLADGRVLVAGGGDEDFNNDETAEVWNPQTGTWSPVAPMNGVRQTSYDFLLPDGRVLLISAGEGGYNNESEIYNPANNQWTAGPTLSERRRLATATRIPDGRIVLCGGVGFSGYMNRTDTYDPVNSRWSRHEALVHRRQQHATVARPDGSVLVIGGMAPAGGSDYTFRNQVEILKEAFELALATEGAGSVARSRDNPLVNGTTVRLDAVASSGYVFSEWAGDASGAANPLTVLMDGPKQIMARFGPDTRDFDGDGLSNHEEILIHHTFIDEFDSDGDGFSDGYEVGLGYPPRNPAASPEGVMSLRAGGVIPPESGVVPPAMEFRFHAAAGKSYEIESSTDLDHWITEEAAVTGEGREVIRSFSTLDIPTRYFRVKRP